MNTIIKALGIWGWMGYQDDLVNVSVNYDPYSGNTFPSPSKEIIAYLEGGHYVVGRRGGMGEADPTIYTDGRFLWTGYYVSCLQDGAIPMDTDLAQHIKYNNFTVPEKETIDFEAIREITR